VVREVSRVMANQSVSITRADPVSSEGTVWSKGSGSPWAGGHQSSELAGLSGAPLTGKKEEQLFPV
jgi:hypothetical protein